MRLANQSAHFHQTAHYKAKLPSSLNHAVIEIHRRTKCCLPDFPAFQSGKSIFKDEWQLGLDRAPFLAAGSGFCFGNVMMNMARHVVPFEHNMACVHVLAAWPTVSFGLTIVFIVLITVSCLTDV